MGIGTGGVTHGTGATVRARKSAGRAYVVLVNWNGWADTIECLESLERLTYPDFRVVVCDNGSTDDSPHMLARWAGGELDAYVPPANLLRRLSFPPAAKPVSCAVLDRDAAGSGGDEAAAAARLVVIRAGENLGFGGGVNLALRYLRALGDAEYVWLLNNDTVVEPDALDALVAVLEEDPRAGLCGSAVLYYSEPDRVQAAGGFHYNRWLGTSRRLLDSRPTSELRAGDPRELRRAMYGIYGASVLASARFLEEVGPMREDYFLYFEEQDWAARGRRRGFGLAVAPWSVVYHKEGRSTGGSDAAGRSELSDYFSIRSRVLFTRLHHPFALPTVLLGLVGVMARRVARGQWRRMGPVLRAGYHGLRAGGTSYRVAK